MAAWVLKLLAAGGLGVGLAKASGPVLIKLLAGTFEVTAGVLDVLGYIMFIAFILGSKKGGEKVGVIWPLSIILEAVAVSLWKS